MATKNIFAKAAALALAGSLSAGCIEEDCIETYLLGTPQIAVEENLGGRVGSVSLEFRTDQRPFVPAEYRGIPVGDNLSIYCAPVDRNGNTVRNNCATGPQFEFYITFTDSDGNVVLERPENYNATRNYNMEDIEINGRESLKAVCSVWSPECAMSTYIDNNGERQGYNFRPRFLVGAAEAEVITEMLCPAPLPPFEPVDEEDLQNATSQ